MRDILGPSGQPLQPHPFLQGSKSTSSNVDTSGIKHAMDDFVSRLEDSISKVFNIREKSIKNITTGEENYWKTAMKYADTYSGMITRQFDMRIAKLKDEQREKENSAKSEIKNAEDVQKRISQIREEYSRKTEQMHHQHRSRLSILEGTETIFGGVQRATGIALPSAGTALSEFGGLISAAASATVFFSTAVIAAAKATVALQERQAELARTASGLVSAGFSLGTTGMGAEKLRTSLFGGSIFERLLSPTQQRQGLGVLSQSPALLDEAATNTEKFQKALFMFGNIMPNSTELLEMFSKNSKELGLNLDELQNVFTVSRLAAAQLSHNQKEFNINQKDTIDIYLNLTKAFRNFTINGNVAAGTLLGLTDFIGKFAKGPQEQQQFSTAIGGGIANLKFSQLAGMFALANGGRLPTDKDFNSIMNHPGRLLGGFLGGITSQFGKGSPEALMAKAQLQEQFFPNLPMRMIPKFNDLINALSAPGITDKDAQKKMAQFDKEAAEADEKGREALTNATTGLTQVENRLLNLWNNVLNDPRKTNIVADVATNILTGNLTGTAVALVKSLKGARHHNSGVSGSF